MHIFTGSQNAVVQYCILQNKTKVTFPEFAALISTLLIKCQLLSHIGAKIQVERAGPYLIFKGGSSVSITRKAHTQNLTHIHKFIDYTHNSSDNDNRAQWIQNAFQAGCNNFCDDCGAIWV